MAKNNTKKYNKYNREYLPSDEKIESVSGLMSKYTDESIHRLTAPKLRKKARGAGKQGYENIKETWGKSKFNKKHISPQIKRFKENQRVKATSSMLHRDYDKIKESKTGKFFGKQAEKTNKEIQSFTKRPSRYVFGKEKAATMMALKGSKAIAIANLNAAAEIKVNEKGIFAVFQPIFWGCKLGALAMSNAYPLLITGLIFGVLFGIWFYGLISAYYALHFLRSLPAVFINVFLTIANGLWFAARGVYQLMSLGIVTIINTMFGYFVGPLYDIIDTLRFWTSDPLVMPNLAFEYTLQPEKGFCYLYPNPMETTGSIGSIALSFFSYSFLRPGEQAYLYDPVTGDIELMIVYTDDINTTLRYPVFNPGAVSDGIWGELFNPETGPPTQVYDFYEGIWGAVLVSGLEPIYNPHVFYRENWSLRIVEKWIENSGSWWDNFLDWVGIGSRKYTVG
jgi:hypothetical protein